MQEEAMTNVLAQARDTVLFLARMRGISTRRTRTTGPINKRMESLQQVCIEGKYCRVELGNPARVVVSKFVLKLHALIIIPPHTTETCYIIPAEKLAAWLSGASSRSLRGFDIESFRNAWQVLKET